MRLAPTDSPMMIQWKSCKKQAKDALLLFRLGDFYEAFHEDAKTLASAVNVTLTQRHGIPMSGVPAHTANTYIEKLIEKGFLVAIAEQVEDPKAAKGIVKREVVQILSPGTFLQSLPSNTNNFFACLYSLNRQHALALIDISTGEFRISEVDSIDQVYDELTRTSPSEVLIMNNQPLPDHIYDHIQSPRITTKEPWNFDTKTALHILTQHFNVHNLDGFGLQGKLTAITAAGTLLSHIHHDLSRSIAHIATITYDSLSEYMSIDQATQRHLELTIPLHPDTPNTTLFHHLNHTYSPMGERLLKTWITHPLLNSVDIQNRQEAVELLTKQTTLSPLLQPIQDLERLMIRISQHKAPPRDLIALKTSLQTLPDIQKHLRSLPSCQLLSSLAFPDISESIMHIENTLVDAPPSKIGDGPMIKPNVHEELDELRTLKSKSQSWIANYQQELRTLTGIKPLKIIFSKTFGYCIEVSRSQSSRVPISFQRRQTLVNTERFISTELKTYEDKILTAEDKISNIESSLYLQLQQTLSQSSADILTVAHSLAILDTLLSLSITANTCGYTKPLLQDNSPLNIKEGRHPIIENHLDSHTFIPNDTLLGQSHSLALITGPNMAGKSTYLRQVAMITIMAQIGSFVPAKHAEIGIVDQVFSRIGASDNLSRGQSTFMLEMTETANILNRATNRSLIILDEIGRGTSTFDGISIAWAVAEHLLSIGCKTLFATHYWELTELEKKHQRITNMHVAVEEATDDIIFLRKIVSGSTNKSYGIHVARLAGVPHSVLQRARELLTSLEAHNNSSSPKQKTTSPQIPSQEEQLSLFNKPPAKTQLNPKLQQLLTELSAVDIDNTSPLKALEHLDRWKTLTS